MTIPTTTPIQRAKAKGWKTWDARSYWCPRILVRKRCRGIVQSSGCGCAFHIRDHPRAWRNAVGIRFLTWEPYGEPASHRPELAKLRRNLAPLGLDYRIESRFETHNPGRCFAVVIHRSEDADALFSR